nr:translation initiation factor IF-2-like [Oryctolagus cuniculus]
MCPENHQNQYISSQAKDSELQRTGCRPRGGRRARAGRGQLLSRRPLLAVPEVIWNRQLAASYCSDHPCVPNRGPRGEGNKAKPHSCGHGKFCSTDRSVPPGGRARGRRALREAGVAREGGALQLARLHLTLVGGWGSGVRGGEPRTAAQTPRGHRATPVQRLQLGALGWASRRSPAPPPPRVGLAGHPARRSPGPAARGGAAGENRAPAVRKVRRAAPRNGAGPPQPAPRGGTRLPGANSRAPARAYLEPAPRSKCSWRSSKHPTARGPGVKFAARRPAVPGAARGPGRSRPRRGPGQDPARSGGGGPPAVTEGRAPRHQCRGAAPRSATPHRTAGTAPGGRGAQRRGAASRVPARGARRGSSEAEEKLSAGAALVATPGALRGDRRRRQAGTRGSAALSERGQPGAEAPPPPPPPPGAEEKVRPPARRLSPSAAAAAAPHSQPGRTRRPRPPPAADWPREAAPLPGPAPTALACFQTRRARPPAISRRQRRWTRATSRAGCAP